MAHARPYPPPLVQSPPAENHPRGNASQVILHANPGSQRFSSGLIFTPVGKKIVAGLLAVLDASLQNINLPVATPPVFGLSKLQVAPASARHENP